MFAKVPRALDEAELERLRHEIVRQFGEDIEFCLDGPLVPRAHDERVTLPPAGPCGQWIDLNVHASYYDPGYRRGDLPLFVKIADWVERVIPGAELWYGHDVGDDTIWPFGPAERARKMEYFNRVGWYDGTTPTNAKR
jgi:hypothetical protein